jgi:hypothetical protein
MCQRATASRNDRPIRPLLADRVVNVLEHLMGRGDVESVIGERQIVDIRHCYLCLFDPS